MLFNLMQSTGVEFPEVTTLWEGEKMRSMGAGVRAKKFAFVPVKVTNCPSFCFAPLSLPAALASPSCRQSLERARADSGREIGTCMY